MSEETENSGKQITENISEFNRTVVITKPEIRKTANQSTPLQRITKSFIRKKLELEDLIGVSNISRYTSDKPDTTAQLKHR